MKDILLFSMIVSITFVSFVVYFVRKGSLKEQYSLLWLFFGLTIIVLSTNSLWLEFLAMILDVKYPPALLFFIGIFICLVLILHLTIMVSKLSVRIVRLTQEIAFIKHELEKSKGE